MTDELMFCTENSSKIERERAEGREEEGEYGGREGGRERDRARERERQREIEQARPARGRTPPPEPPPKTQQSKARRAKCASASRWEVGKLTVCCPAYVLRASAVPGTT
jgi:hypothetical protein